MQLQRTWPESSIGSSTGGGQLPPLCEAGVDEVAWARAVDAPLPEALSLTRGPGERWRLRDVRGVAGAKLEAPLSIDLAAFELEFPLRVVRLEYNSLLDLYLRPGQERTANRPDEVNGAEVPVIPDIRITLMRRESETQSVYDVTFAIGRQRLSVYRQRLEPGFLVGERYRLRLRSEAGSLSCSATATSRAGAEYEVAFSLPFDPGVAAGPGRTDCRLLLGSRSGRAGVEVEVGRVRVRSR